MPRGFSVCSRLAPEASTGGFGGHMRSLEILEIRVVKSLGEASGVRTVGAAHG